MEGDAGSGQLNPTPPVAADQTADLSPQSRLLADRRPTAVIAGIAASAVLIGAAGALAFMGHHRNVASVRDETTAVARAKDCIIATQAPDVTAMADNQRTIVECSTETFAAESSLYSGLIADAYRTMNTRLKVADIGAAPERHNPDGSINVLVALRVVMSNDRQEGQEISYRLRVRMMPDSGTYKVDNIEAVSK